MTFDELLTGSFAEQRKERKSNTARAGIETARWLDGRERGQKYV